VDMQFCQRYSALVKEAVYTINLSQAAPGVYFIKVKQNGAVVTKKIMKN